MYNLSPPTSAFRSFGSLVLIGFLALVFLGPVVALVAALLSAAVAIVSAFLPFALIGLLVWVPYRLLTGGKQAAWEGTRDVVQNLGRAVWSAPRWCCAKAWAVACGMGSAMAAFHRKVWHFLAGFLLETLSGALLGMLIATISRPEWPGFGLRLGLGAAVGASVGALIALSRFGSTQEPAAEQT